MPIKSACKSETLQPMAKSMWTPASYYCFLWPFITRIISFNLWPIAIKTVAMHPDSFLPLTLIGCPVSLFCRSTSPAGSFKRIDGLSVHTPSLFPLTLASYMTIIAPLSVNHLLFTWGGFKYFCHLIGLCEGFLTAVSRISQSNSKNI